MAGIISVGSKVQAVDVLGRWENGRVLEKNNDRVKVSFSGWDSQWNREVEEDEVRLPVPPLEQQIRLGSVKPCNRKLVKSTLLKQRKALKHLTNEDEVVIGGENLKVHQVDQFNQTLVVLRGEQKETISITEIQVQEECDDAVEAVPKVKKRKCPATFSEPKDQGVQTTSMVHNFIQPDDDNCIDEIFGIKVGELYKMKNSNLVLAITNINIFKCQICGIPFMESMETDTIVTTQVNKLEETKTIRTLTGLEKRYLSELKESASKNTIRNLSNIEYRRQYRKMQLASAVKLEVSVALRRRQRAVNSFNLGLLTPDVDNIVLELKEKSSKFSYKNNNLSHIDNLLGPEWDIFVFENVTSYVTCLSFHVNKKSMLTGSVSVATHGIVGSNYRHNLAQHIKNINAVVIDPPPVH